MTGSDRSVSDPFALCRFKTQLNSQDERNKIERIEMTDPCHSSVANPLNSSSGSYSNSVDNNSIDPMSLTGLLASYFESQTWRSAKSSQRLLFTVVKVIKDAKIVQLWYIVCSTQLKLNGLQLWGNILSGYTKVKPNKPSEWMITIKGPASLETSTRKGFKRASAILFSFVYTIIELKLQTDWATQLTDGSLTCSIWEPYPAGEGFSQGKPDSKGVGHTRDWRTVKHVYRRLTCGRYILV